MPDTIFVVAVVSAFFAVPALGMALFHGTRTEKHLHLSREDKGEPRS